MLLAELADFVARHRNCGVLSGVATEPAPDGYMLSIVCAGGEERRRGAAVGCRERWFRQLGLYPAYALQRKATPTPPPPLDETVVEGIRGKQLQELPKR